jgi:hypothetical protein
VEWTGWTDGRINKAKAEKSLVLSWLLVYHFPLIRLSFYNKRVSWQMLFVLAGFGLCPHV